MQFSRGQFRRLADFNQRIAEGLFLGAFVGQVFMPVASFIARFTVALLYGSIALLFLHFSLVLSKEAREDGK